MSVTSCYVGQGQPSTDGDITWEKKREKHLVLVSVLFNGQWVGQMTRVMDQIPQTHFRAYHQQYILLVFDSQPGHIKIKTFIFSIIGTSRTKSKYRASIFWCCSIHFLFLSCYIEEITTNSLDKCYQEQNTVISIVCCKKLGMDDIPNICDGLSW